MVIEEFMYRVARRPLSKLIALLPAAEPPPTFEELEPNVSRACPPVTLRQNASGSRGRPPRPHELFQGPFGLRRPPQGVAAHSRSAADGLQRAGRRGRPPPRRRSARGADQQRREVLPRLRSATAEHGVPRRQ